MNHFLGKSVGVLFAVLSACVLPACKTDLSDVWNSIDNIDDRLSQVEKKIEEMNTNIDALSKICDALSSNVSVSSVTPLQDATYISVDGGKTWTRISGENGVSFFESVKADESPPRSHWSWLTER